MSPSRAVDAYNELHDLVAPSHTPLKRGAYHGEPHAEDATVTVMAILYAYEATSDLLQLWMGMHSP
jgi:hypothetical protein